MDTVQDKYDIKNEHFVVLNKTLTKVLFHQRWGLDQNMHLYIYINKPEINRSILWI